jgi:hypothetical protein
MRFARRCKMATLRSGIKARKTPADENGRKVAALLLWSRRHESQL